MHKASSYQMRQKPVHAKDLALITKSSDTGKNSVIKNLFSIKKCISLSVSLSEYSVIKMEF